MLQTGQISPGVGHLDLDALSSVSLDQETLEERKIVGFDSRDRRSRPFNLMRTQLLKKLEAEDWRMIGITSATPAAGKSFISVNLAAALSRVLEGTTVLLDLDLRRGCVAQELGLQFECGVGDLLAGRIDALQTIGLRVAESNLVIFPTRPASIDSAQALAAPRFKNLVAELREQSRKGVVIVDLPPVFANDDAALTTQMLDGFLMVVECGKTSRRQLTDAMEMLRPVPCLGTVLNRYSGGILDSYGYGSSSYDSYYSG